MMMPLAGIRVVEFEGLSLGPLAGRMLVDMGTGLVYGRNKRLINSPSTRSVNACPSAQPLKRGPATSRTPI